MRLIYRHARAEEAAAALLALDVATAAAAAAACKGGLEHQGRMRRRLAAMAR